MKKNAIFIMIFSLVLVSGNFALAQDQGPSQRPVNPGINNNGPKSSNRNPGQGLDKGKQGPKSNKDAKPGKPNPVDNKNKAMPNQNNAAQKEGPNSDMQKPRDDGRAMPENINLFTTNTATSTGEQEKISNPQDMKSFEKIKKVGNALYGTRKDGIQKPAFIKPEVAQCVKDAISKKSTAIKAAVSAHDQTALTS
ncbi:MAG: hypothetical protein NT091_01965, partial [Candidatus Falkowbacteria bacterium]|nr:hypothetical protein [Candidatus Falkowbacteria bacterium]